MRKEIMMVSGLTLLSSCSNPTDVIKEHPNQKEIDSLEIERDKAQKRLDSLIKVRDSRI